MMTKASDTKKSKGSAFRYLPPGYQPGPFDVLCGRGRKCYFHSGNEHFRAFVRSMIPKYNSATSKMEKGYILSVIVQNIRDRAGMGGFIKQDPKSSLWYEVGDFLAREKVSQAFRDALSDKYKSSNAYKKMRREVEQTGQLFETFLQNKDTSPEPKKSSQTTAIDNKVQKQIPQPSFSMVGKSPCVKEMSFTDSLIGLLEQDIARPKHQLGFSQDALIDLEPRPIAEPNLFAHQATPISCPSIFEPHALAQLQKSFGSNNGLHQAYQNIQVQPLRFPQGLEQMFRVGETQNTFKL